MDPLNNNHKNKIQKTTTFKKIYVKERKLKVKVRTNNEK